MTIHEYDQDWPPEPHTTSTGLTSTLDGHIVFLHQAGGFWIAAEENDPEQIEVHVAQKRRYGVVEQETPQTAPTGFKIAVSYC